MSHVNSYDMTDSLLPSGRSAGISDLSARTKDVGGDFSESIEEGGESNVKANPVELTLENFNEGENVVHCEANPAPPSAVISRFPSNVATLFELVMNEEVDAPPRTVSLIALKLGQG